jgi:putative glutamine amidotransferase
VSTHVLIVGRLSEEAKGVRGLAFAAGRRSFHAIERAGGVPFMLPPIPSIVDQLDASVARFDAIVLHGGGDVDPNRYGEEPTAEQVYGIVHEHDEVELAVVEAAVRHDIPMLAVCRGLQVLNVALGGTLVQHIGSEEHWFQHHPVTITPGSRLASAIGSNTANACHSVHHQAIKAPGRGVTVVGRAADGTVEAVEVDDARWIVGTQWHPEDSADTDPQQQALFDEPVRQVARQ